MLPLPNIFLFLCEYILFVNLFKKNNNPHHPKHHHQMMLNIYIQGQRAICWMFFISIFIFHFRLCLWVFYFTHSFLSRPFFLTKKNFVFIYQMQFCVLSEKFCVRVGRQTSQASKQIIFTDLILDLAWLFVYLFSLAEWLVYLVCLYKLFWFVLAETLF